MRKKFAAVVMEMNSRQTKNFSFEEVEIEFDIGRNLNLEFNL